MVDTSQEMVREKSFFKVRKKSGNFTLSRKIKVLERSQGKWNFKSTYLFFCSTFIVLNNKVKKERYKESTIRGHRKNLSPRWDWNPRASVFYCFVTFTILLYILRAGIMLHWQNFVHEIERQADAGFSRKSILFALYVKEPINLLCMWLNESIKKGVKRFLWREGCVHYQD